MAHESDEEIARRKQREREVKKAWKKFEATPEFLRRNPNGLPAAGANSHSKRVHLPRSAS